MPENKWDPDDYDGGHGFVTEYGADVVELLDPQPDERVLDIGCGTGHLAAEIADCGADVVGIDAAEEMVTRAREQYPGLTFEVADAREYEPERRFDAVFSNAALHWIPDTDHDAVLSMVADALTEGGRFVAELGGAGNIARVERAVRAELADSGYDAENLWYFPSIGEYTPRLESHGLEVAAAWLFDRPTTLDGGPAGLREWVEMFGDEVLAPVDDGERGAVLDGVEERLRPALYDTETETWTVDYRRLRFVASKYQTASL
ncbi:Trans-aconitate methyltransferase [Haloarcula vallismortis]|uniref:Methyltransferase n=2 Tax=Haloarcula vallismortis TaxID=28442 RepID=M0IZ13_HALVA|nr:methyltransferase domain-containing protein [Haloarcula vallismortis]EMA00690.1 methyltransferase [Haloarcula vallismortis ATCC 29715]SDW03218.1 Trans-aconitate methyltransferase [Haloarcula vallismortis]